MPDNEKENVEIEPMNHREITLADGRYMIFYTFGDESKADETPDADTENNV